MQRRLRNHRKRQVRRPFLGALGRIVAIVGGAGTVLTLLGAIF